jgi:glutathione S-transferase
MKLIASLTSPYARKIRIILAEKQIPFELVVDSPWTAETHVPDYNPLGKVPALVADDGECWFDSPVIAAYLDSLWSPTFIPEEPYAALVARQTEALADGITDAAVAALLERNRPPEQQGSGFIPRQLEKIARGLDALEARLRAGKGLGSAELSLGDIAAGCTLGYLDFRHPGLEWRGGHPGLATLAERLFARESFATTTPPAS